MNDRWLGTPIRPDADRTTVAPSRRHGARPPLPAGVAPPTTRRIRPVPPVDPDCPWGEAAGDEPDDWDRRADRLEWWMSDLGGPYPVSVQTLQTCNEASRLLERGLRRFGIDVIEANASLLKGLSPPPAESALVRLVRWLGRHPARLEVVEVRLESTGVQCRVSARASGERSAEALRVALSDLSPAPRRPAPALTG